MRRPPRAAIAVLALLLVAAAGWFLLRSGGGEADVMTGYVEGETLYLAAPIAGPVAEVHVARGQRVAAGQPLFAMDDQILAAQRERSRAAAQVAAAQARDTRKGQRPAELAITEAQINAAQARAREARLRLDRSTQLAQRGFLAPAGLDAARADHDARLAELRALQGQRAVGGLGARSDAQAAASANLDQAQAALTESERRLAQLAPSAPAGGVVEEVFFQAGEWAAANQPIVALIPDGRVRIRFFAPQAELTRLRVGSQVRFSCDGCGGLQAAVVRYVSPRPEFTPPVIYGRQSRERLVFLVEAEPVAAEKLIPGLPVDVERPRS